LEPRVDQQALAWVAWLFGVPIESLNRSQRFGFDLKPASRSFYGRETLDVITDDIVDIERALKEKVLKENAEFTVGDFCDLIERLQRQDPKGCQRLLRSWNKIITIDEKPTWRRLLFKTVGI
jgi:hypothetical protein